MEPGTPRSNRVAQEEKYFVNEQAVYSREGPRSKEGSHLYMQAGPATFEELGETYSRIGSEK